MAKDNMKKGKNVKSDMAKDNYEITANKNSKYTVLKAMYGKNMLMFVITLAIDLAKWSP